MAKRLHRKDAPIGGIARVLVHQIDGALRALSRVSLTDRGVHDLRKRLKEARASLRLLRREIGRSDYHRTNRRLRDAARPFAEVRDAKVLVEKFNAIAPALREHRDIVAEIRRYLAVERREARRHALGGHAARSAKKSVRDARAHVMRFSKSSHGWPVAAKGLRRVYGRARKALRDARLHTTVESLHEWRKQTKYLRHGLEVLLPRGAGGASTARSSRARGAGRKSAPKSRGTKGGDLAAQAHRLTDLLGEDHDLAVLGAKLLTGRMAGGVQERAVRQIEPGIVSRRSKLQREAFTLGRRLFARTPAAFERAVHDRWRRWRHG